MENAVVSNSSTENTVVNDNPVVSTGTNSDKDLIKRVSEFKKVQPNDNKGEDFFDYKEIENIKDPVAKDIALKAYKSMQSGLTKKTQALADERKSLESKLNEMQTWSPQRIEKELLNNPQFLQAAQQIAGTKINQNPSNSGLTDEEYSALSDKEKAEFSAIKSQNSVLAQEINALKQNNYQAMVMQHDLKLQAKFPDYNPVEVDNTIKNLANMSPLDIREHVYKSLRYNDNVQSAYELGRQDALKLNQEKLGAISTTGNINMNTEGMPVRDKSDTDQSWFIKIAQFRLAQQRRK